MNDQELQERRKVLRKRAGETESDYIARVLEWSNQRAIEHEEQAKREAAQRARAQAVARMQDEMRLGLMRDASAWVKRQGRKPIVIAAAGVMVASGLLTWWRGRDASPTVEHEDAPQGGGFGGFGRIWMGGAQRMILQEQCEPEPEPEPSRERRPRRPRRSQEHDVAPRVSTDAMVMRKRCGGWGGLRPTTWAAKHGRPPRRHECNSDATYQRVVELFGEPE